MLKITSAFTTLFILLYIISCSDQGNYYKKISYHQNGWTSNPLDNSNDVSVNTTDIKLTFAKELDLNNYSPQLVCNELDFSNYKLVSENDNRALTFSINNNALKYNYTYNITLENFVFTDGIKLNDVNESEQQYFDNKLTFNTEAGCSISNISHSDSSCFILNKDQFQIEFGQSMDTTKGKISITATDKESSSISYTANINWQDSHVSNDTAIITFEPELSLYHTINWEIKDFHCADYPVDESFDSINVVDGNYINGSFTVGDDTLPQLNEELTIPKPNGTALVDDDSGAAEKLGLTNEYVILLSFTKEMDNTANSLIECSPAINGTGKWYDAYTYGYTVDSESLPLSSLTDYSCTLSNFQDNTCTANIVQDLLNFTTLSSTPFSILSTIPENNGCSESETEITIQFTESIGLNRVGSIQLVGSVSGNLNNLSLNYSQTVMLNDTLIISPEQSFVAGEYITVSIDELYSESGKNINNTNPVIEFGISNTAPLIVENETNPKPFSTNVPISSLTYNSTNPNTVDIVFDKPMDVTTISSFTITPNDFTGIDNQPGWISTTHFKFQIESGEAIPCQVYTVDISGVTENSCSKLPAEITSYTFQAEEGSIEPVNTKYPEDGACLASGGNPNGMEVFAGRIYMVFNHSIDTSKIPLITLTSSTKGDISYDYVWSKTDTSKDQLNIQPNIQFSEETITWNVQNVFNKCGNSLIVSNYTFQVGDATTFPIILPDESYPPGNICVNIADVNATGYIEIKFNKAMNPNKGYFKLIPDGTPNPPYVEIDSENKISGGFWLPDKQKFRIPIINDLDDMNYNYTIYAQQLEDASCLHLILDEPNYYTFYVNNSSTPNSPYCP